MMKSRALGSPNSETWPEVKQLPAFSNQFPKWEKRSLDLKGDDEDAIDLIKVVFRLYF
jgi:hypothetical protein